MWWWWWCRVVWCAVSSSPLNPAKTFLFGAIAVYGIRFFMGRIVALTQISSNLASATAAVVLFALAYFWVLQAEQSEDNLR